MRNLPRDLVRNLYALLVGDWLAALVRNLEGDFPAVSLRNIVTLL